MDSFKSSLKDWKKQQAKAKKAELAASVAAKQKPKPQAAVDNQTKDLFKQQMQGVTPLKNTSADTLSVKPKAPPVPRFTQQDQLAVLDESLHNDDFEPDAAADLHYVREGLQHRTVKKLGKGQYAVQGELDLHGHNAAEAQAAVKHFLDYSNSAGKQCVRIIHGKGLHSEHNPVLKSKLGSWLRRRNDVLAFTSARPQDGGNGAVYVLLKAK